MNLSNNNEKKSRKSGIASLFGKGSVSKIGKSQFPKSMGGIMERLKGLSRKDLALVGVGLSVLVAAPVAEYMMSKPADSANMLTSGFSSRDAQGTSALASLYEPGINALSQGSADGSGEVITPLSARDPSSLILGAQPEQSPMPDYSSMMGGMGGSDTSSSSSGSSSGPSDYNDLRDTVKDAARHGAAKAVQNAGTPTVINRMGTMFRGEFGAVKTYGGSGTTGDGKKLSTPSKANMSAKQSKMVNPVSSGGFKGATNNPRGGDSSAADKLRAKADAQGGFFSGASAVKSADAANAIKMNEKVGGDNFGSGFDGTGYGKGSGWKAPSDKGATYSHRHSGECNTLACQAAKKRQDKALEWEFFLKYDIPKEFIKAGVGALTGFIGDAAKKGTALLFNEDVDGITSYYCLEPVDPNKPVNMDNACNAKITNKTKKMKTRDNWKTCSQIVTSSEYKKYYKSKCGSINAGGLPEDNVSNEQPQTLDDQFEKYVTTYDQGLQKFMAELAVVIKKSSSPKGVTAAETSANTYVSMSEGDGFGYSFDQLFNHIANQAHLREGEISKNESKIAEVQANSKAELAKASQFSEKLQDIMHNPDKYQKAAADGSVHHVSEETKEAIKAKYEDYMVAYRIRLKDEHSLKGYREANDVLKIYNTEVQTVNSRIHEEYRPGYTTLVDDLVKKDISSLKNDPKKYTKVFTEKMYGAAVIPDPNDPGPYDYVQPPTDDGILVTVVPQLYGRILSAPKEPEPAEASPAGKARLWRGFPHTFGTDIKDKSENSKDLKVKYEEQAKNTKNDEIKNWEKDCPLDITGGEPTYEPRANIEEIRTNAHNTAMSKNQFYAPGYRVIYEIKPALAHIWVNVDNINANINVFAAKREEIIKYLASIDILIDGQNNNNNNNNNNSDPNNNNGNPGENNGGSTPTTPLAKTDADYANSGPEVFDNYAKGLPFVQPDTLTAQMNACNNGNYPENPRCKERSDYWNRERVLNYVDENGQEHKIPARYKDVYADRTLNNFVNKNPDNQAVKDYSAGVQKVHLYRDYLDKYYNDHNRLGIYIKAAERQNPKDEAKIAEMKEHKKALERVIVSTTGQLTNALRETDDAFNRVKAESKKK